jgi:3-hydroxyacyl-CoA dehydrogenase / 3-hydroxy-2-methylbutyryl-CoA dehydrogenase
MDTPMMAKSTPEVRKGLEADVQFPKRMGFANEFSALVLHDSFLHVMT